MEQLPYNYYFFLNAGKSITNFYNLNKYFKDVVFKERSQ